MKVKMSITRALAEMKQLQARIQDASSADFVTMTVGKNTKRKLTTAGTVEQKEKELQSNYDSVVGLINRRQQIKKAVVMSNATTKVTLGTNEYTVAEAIELKSSVNLKEQLLVNMKSQYAAVSSQVQRSNQQLDTQIDTLLTTVYGADKSKINDESYALVANPQKDNKEATMLDPICIAQRIKDLSDEISSIKTELDFVLSESNARTEIEV